MTPDGSGADSPVGVRPGTVVIAWYTDVIGLFAVFGAFALDVDVLVFALVCIAVAVVGKFGRAGSPLAPSVSRAGTPCASAP